VFNGSGYTDWISSSDFTVSATLSTSVDAWWNSAQGMIHFINNVPVWAQTAVRTTYRIGGDDNYPDTVPRQIKQACARRVCVDLIPMERFANMLPGGVKGALSMRENISVWTTEMYEKLARYRRTLAYVGAE